MVSKNRQWRVNISHIRGYYAPYIIVETTEPLLYKAEAEAVAEAKERSRLSDFKEWSFEAECTGKKLVRGKWVDNWFTL